MLLYPSGNFWMAENEATLEEFIWKTLPELLNLKPLAKQLSINGYFCDILAADHNNSPVIIELKNTEDRYIVQQLTRYYDAILSNRPFADQLNYQCPVKLIAIAPRFHKDNFTDCKYTTLQIDLLTFEIIQSQEDFLFSLKGSEGHPITQIPIQNGRFQAIGAIPDPPRKLINMLRHEEASNQDLILKTRQQILESDSRMEEMSESTSILYGKGKQICAELRMRGKSEEINLFLWLPNANNKKKVERMLIWTCLKWREVHHFSNYPRAFKRPQVGSYIWDAPHFIDHMKGLGYSQSLEAYQPLIQRPAEDWVKLEAYVDLAIVTWQKQLAF